MIGGPCTSFMEYEPFKFDLEFLNFDSSGLKIVANIALEPSESIKIEQSKLLNLSDSSKIESACLPFSSGDQLSIQETVQDDIRSTEEVHSINS
jgi:hypothetical protein